MTQLKSIPWRLAEFYYNRGLQRPFLVLAQSSKKQLTGFFNHVLFFLKSKTPQLSFEECD